MVHHSVATWGSALSSVDGATNDCRNGDPTATLINATVADLDCLKAYRTQLLSEFPNYPGIATSDLWLEKRYGQCVRFVGKTDTIVTTECNVNERARYLCTRPVQDAGKWNILKEYSKQRIFLSKSQ